MQHITRVPNPFPLRFIVGGLIVALAIGYLMYSAMQTSAVYYVEVDELLTMGPEAYEQPLRVNGILDRSSVQWDPATLTLRFNVIKENYSLPVIYKNVPPDTFYEGESVVAEGKYGSDGFFYADTIFVRCPSKYEAATQEAL